MSSTLGQLPPPDRWAEALASLNDDDRLQLSLVDKDKLVVLREFLDITADEKRLCIQKRWKINRHDGRVVIIRDLFKKIAVWVQKFREI